MIGRGYSILESDSRAYWFFSDIIGIAILISQTKQTEKQKELNLTVNGLGLVWICAITIYLLNQCSLTVKYCKKKNEKNFVYPNTDIFFFFVPKLCFY